MLEIKLFNIEYAGVGVSMVGDDIIDLVNISPGWGVAEHWIMFDVNTRPGDRNTAGAAATCRLQQTNYGVLVATEMF